MMPFYDIAAVRGTRGSALRSQVSVKGKMAVVSEVLAKGMYNVRYSDGKEPDPNPKPIPEFEMSYLGCNKDCAKRSCEQIAPFGDPRLTCGLCPRNTSNETCSLETVFAGSGTVIPADPIDSVWASKLMMGVDSESKGRGWEAVLQSSAAEVCPVQKKWCELGLGQLPNQPLGPGHVWRNANTASE